MAIQRAKNNKAVFEAVPGSFIPKNEKSGEIVVSTDFIVLEDLVSPVDGDVVYAQEIPANYKVKAVTVYNLETIADGNIVVGHSNNEVVSLGQREEVVAADPDAFIAATDLAGETKIEMPETAVGFLTERDVPVFLTVTLATVPTVLDAKKLVIVTELIGK